MPLNGPTADDGFDALGALGARSSSRASCAALARAEFAVAVASHASSTVVSFAGARSNTLVVVAAALACAGGTATAKRATSSDAGRDERGECAKSAADMRQRLRLRARASFVDGRRRRSTSRPARAYERTNARAFDVFHAVRDDVRDDAARGAGRGARRAQTASGDADARCDDDDVRDADERGARWCVVCVIDARGARRSPRDSRCGRGVADSV